MPQEQQMQDMAGGGLASLPAANFNNDSFVGGGIIAFADEGEVPEPKGDKKSKTTKKSGAKGKKDAAPVEAITPEPVKPAAPAASTPEPVKPAAKVPVYDPAEFRAGQGAAGAEKGSSSLLQRGRAAVNNAAGRVNFNLPTVTASGLADAAGSIGKFAGKGLLGAMPITGIMEGARTIGGDPIPTENMREYYGLETDNPTFLGDLGIRALGIGHNVLTGGMFGPGRNEPPAPPPAKPAADAASEKDKSGLTADQRAAAIIAGIGGGGGGAGGGGGRAGAGGAGAGNAVANTGFSPELKTLMDSRAANLAEMKAQLATDKPKGLEDYIKAEENIYAKAGIGNAAKEEKERLNARLAGMQGEQKAAFLRDLSKAGFAMAQNASQHGATFLGSAAAGGMNFSESNAKTAEHFANLSETLASTKAKLAQSDEAVRAGMIAKGSAEHKEARKEYANAQRDLTRYEGTMNASDIAAVRAIEVARMQADRNLATAHVTGQYQLQAAQMRIAGKENVEKQLGAAYLAAMKKSPPDIAAAQAILKQLQAVTEAVNPQRFNAPPKALDPTQILTLRSQLNSAKKRGNKEDEAFYTSLLAREGYMPSEAAAGAGTATSGNWSVVK